MVYPVRIDDTTSTRGVFVSARICSLFRRNSFIQAIDTECND